MKITVFNGSHRGEKSITNIMVQEFINKGFEVLIKIHLRETSKNGNREKNWAD